MKGTPPLVLLLPQLIALKKFWESSSIKTIASQSLLAKENPHCNSSGFHHHSPTSQSPSHNSHSSPSNNPSPSPSNVLHAPNVFVARPRLRNRREDRRIEWPRLVLLGRRGGRGLRERKGRFIPLAAVSVFLFFSSSPAIEINRFSRSISPASLGLLEEKLSHLHFYFHDIVSGPKPTTVRVEEVPTTNTSLTGFGEVVVIDGFDSDSKPMGRAGSTLNVLGRNKVSDAVRESGIVGGSGAFRFARGYALAKTSSSVSQRLRASMERMVLEVREGDVGAQQDWMVFIRGIYVIF